MKLRSIGCLAMLAVCGGMAQAEPVETLYAQGQQALPGGWKPLAKTERAAVFVHADARPLDGKLAVWMHSELAEPDYVEKDKAYVAVRERMLVDCKGERTGSTEWVAYPARFAGGNAVAREKRDKDMLDAVPDSLEAQLVKSVCAPKPRPQPQPVKAKPKAVAQADKDVPPAKPEPAKSSAGKDAKPKADPSKAASGKKA